MMAEGEEVSGAVAQEANKTRQDGDGFESNGNGATTQTSLPTSGIKPEKDNQQKELQKVVTLSSVKENGTEGEAEIIASEDEKSSNTSSPSIARASLSSPKELRQQFRLLQSQELIRRILQSTVVVPNNQKQRKGTKGNSRNLEDIKSNSLEKSSPKQNNLENIQSRAEHETEELRAEEKSLEDKKEAELLAVKIEDTGSQGSGGPNAKLVNGTEELMAECSAQQASNFVCSLCNTDASMIQNESNNNQAQPAAKEVESFQSTHDGSVISLSSPNSEEEQEKTDAIVHGVDTKVPDLHHALQGTHPPDVHQLSERLQQQPSHETLDEILKLLQNQASGIPPHHHQSPRDQHNKSEIVQKPVLQQSNVADPGLLVERMVANEAGKQQPQLAMMGTQPNLREKHSRQLADMKDYYEGEMLKLREQLDLLRSNLSVLQEAVPVKMLEATNHRLEARCHLMEEIASDLKSKYNRLDQSNQELEATCHELRQTNEAVEMRCLLLQKSNQELDERNTEILNNSKILESRILHLNQANEKAHKSCKQLEDANKNFERSCRELEEVKNKMENRYRKSKEENLKLSGDIRDLQVSLLSSNKHSQELEETIAALQNEKVDWGLKLDASQKMSQATQKRYTDIKAEAEKKDAMNMKMEEQMNVLSGSLENTTKAREELEKNAERDKELLKRLLIEYDALAKEHQQFKVDADSWAEKMNSSQDEVNSLRGTITKLIRRNTTLEDSLREALVHQIGSKTKAESTPPTTRKTWDTTLKNGTSDPKGTTSLLLEYDFPSRGPRTSSPAKTDHAHMDRVTLGDVSRISSTPYKSQEWSSGRTFGSAGIKFEIPWENPPKSPSPTKSTVKRNLEKSYSPEKTTNNKSPGGLVLKKSDLVTRFDVVFEDSKSGEEVKRSHTGRTSRAQGESPTSIFVSNSGTTVAETSPSDRLVSDAAEAALTALRTGRVTSQGEAWDYRETATARKRRERSRERRTGKTAEESKDKHEDAVNKLERKFSSLTEERKRLESTLSRIPNHRTTKRSKEDKVFLENRLEDVVKEIGSVRMQLRRHHAL